MRVHRLLLCAFAACSSNPNEVEVTLAPDVVSSLDGTLQVHAVLLHDRDVETKQNVTISIDYTDRNGMAHMIASVNGTTDQRGEFDTTIMGLMWDGTGTVSAAAEKGPTGTATFSVLDRTPPKVSITAPATAHAGTTVNVTVMATDEIGVSQITFQNLTGNNGNCGGNGCFGDRGLITNGATSTMESFTFDINQQAAVGTTFTLSALAADLSGNLGYATPVTVTVN